MLKWRDLSHATGTILERIDINRSDVKLVISEELNIPYFKGIITEEIAKEIIDYQNSDEHEGNYVYQATRNGNELYIKFLRSAFD